MFSAPFWLVLVVAAVYFMPTIVATAKHHHATAGVFWVNLLIGWTVVGWFVAFIWAFSPRRAEPVVAAAPAPGRICLKCGALLQLSDRFCAQCGTVIPI